MLSARRGFIAVFALIGFAASCSSAPDAGLAPRGDAGNGSNASDGSDTADACPGDACCCDGDISDTVQCTASGTMSCRSGFMLHQGAECGCPGPCCTPPPDGGLATGDDAGDANQTCPGDACCCEGDVLDTVQCGASGTMSCRSGFTLHHGTECGCPGPCCTPPPDGGLATGDDAGDSAPTPGDGSVASLVACQVGPTLYGACFNGGCPQYTGSLAFPPMTPCLDNEVCCLPANVCGGFGDGSQCMPPGIACPSGSSPLPISTSAACAGDAAAAFSPGCCPSGWQCCAFGGIDSGEGPG